MVDLKAVAKEQEYRCRVKSKAYSIWLAKLFPANLLLVVGAAIFALISGSANLFQIGDYDYTLIAGILGLLSAVFTIIHTKLKCDEHQAECKGLKSKFESMAEQYLGLRTFDNEDVFRKKLQELDKEFSKILAEANAQPSNKAVSKAKEFLLNSAIP